ncbi:outer membrane beta-barrel protein [Tautonia rosea]|uniref:outer membrane beta-barrel protein n=1 Tax=Tautonia rosea TaxID=2728037 RepID=UPI001473A4A2|nr:outer membrane beta-barrel protein [Tautonia rosea]
MRTSLRAGVVLGLIAALSVVAVAQEIPLPPLPDYGVSSSEIGAVPPPGGSEVQSPRFPDYDELPRPLLTDLTLPGAFAGLGLETQSLPAEQAEDIVGAPEFFRLGPYPVSDVDLLSDALRSAGLLDTLGIDVFGWVEGGYTGASTRPGLLSVQPRLNRFGDEFLLNEIGLVIDRPLRQDRFDVGFFVRYFAGANAATGQPLGGIGGRNPDPRFSQDFRDLYLSFHLPILTERGLDFKIGRMNTIIGYNGFLAPYRPFYSNDYQFFYAQDGAFTGFLANLHVTDRLDVWSGMTMGANTFFTLRSEDSYCYIGQVNYWLTDERRTRLTGSVYAGPDAIFAAPGLNGDFVTMVELRLQQNWSEKLTQVIQNNMGWDRNTPVGTGSFYGIYTQFMYHLAPKFDVNFRADWFSDPEGTRTGFDTEYFALTLGTNWHPNRILEVRPEIRGDFAGEPAFGGGGAPGGNFSQLTGGVSFLVKY